MREREREGREREEGCEVEEARSGPPRRKKVMAVMTSLSPETSGATRSRERSGVGEEHSPTFTRPPPP